MTAVESAIIAWVAGASGLAAGKVYWQDQTAPRPAAPCIGLKIADDTTVGHDWIDTALDAGTDVVTFTARGVRTASLTMQCFAVDPTGVSAAVAILKGVLAKSALPSYADALEAADIGIGTIGPVQGIGGAAMNMVVFEPRAVCTVTLHLTSEVSEVGNIIESVEITGEVSD